MRKESCVLSVEGSHRVGAVRPALTATSIPVQEQRMPTVESKGHPPSLIPYFLHRNGQLLLVIPPCINFLILLSSPPPPPTKIKYQVCM